MEKLGTVPVSGPDAAPTAADLRDEFAAQYRLAQAPVLLEVERLVCGSDYGCTSWMTRDEADALGRLLRLAPGRRLLEVGAGSGWPGLHLARTTGCDVALIDVPAEGLCIAADRAAAEGLAGRCTLAAADGAALPFADATFDAVSHSDVLCCLEDKAAVLAACRRVARAGASMVFTVILVAPDASPSGRQRARAFGPLWVETGRGYAEMLADAGWRMAEVTDLSAAFTDAAGLLLDAEEARAEELCTLYGEAKFAEKMARRHGTVGAIGDGLLRRHLFAATPG